MATPLVALITAGSAGLGAATAKLFSQRGLRVVINYNSNTERADNLAKELQTLSPLKDGNTNFGVVKGDLGVRADLIRMVDETVNQMGRLDVVFSNGGWTKFADIRNLDENLVDEDWDKCFNINVKSHLFLMHAAKPHLEKTEGVFITTSSLAGVVSSGSSLAYSVTKAAQLHLVKGLAMAVSPKVRVNAVSPGLMLTEWGLKYSKEKQEANRNKTQLKKLATVEDVAEQVYCYVQQKTVTGANAIIDGGASL